MEKWFKFSLITFVLWGLWAFFSKITADLIGPLHGLFFEIIGAVIVGIILLFVIKFKVEYHSKGTTFAVISGFLSIGGVALFLYALNLGNSIIIVPLAALYPGVTVILNKLFLKEDLTKKQWFGIILAIVASVLLGI